MGQKIHPKNYRLGVIYDWSSKWFAKGAYQLNLRQDVMIREFIRKKLADARVDAIDIERSGKGGDITVNISTAKPGMVIGRGGAGIEELKKEVEKKVLKGQARVNINISEIRTSALSAAVVAQNIASDLTRRVAFRRSIKLAIDQVQKAGAKGVKVRVNGRLNGAEIARKETLSWGSIPLHTIRADIDYAQAGALTTYGMIGVTVWIYKGEIFGTAEEKETANVLDEIKKIAREKKE